MTIQELLQQAGRYPWVITGFFASVPLVTWIAGRLHGRGRGGAPPWTYIYATLVYVSCVPGLFAAVVTAYALLLKAGGFNRVRLRLEILTKTKTPKLQVLDTERSPRAIDRLLEKFQHVDRAVSAGAFPRNENARNCVGCEFRARCPV